MKSPNNSIKHLRNPLIVGVIVLVAVIAIVVSLYQSGRGPLAPTAPESQPSASQLSDESCTVNFPVSEVTDENNTLTCKALAFADEFDNTTSIYNLRRVVQGIQAGGNVVWNVEVTNNGTQDAQLVTIGRTTTGNGSSALTYLDSNCTTIAGNSSNQICHQILIAPGSRQSFTVRDSISSSASLGSTIQFSGKASNTDGSIIATCQLASPLVIASSTYQQGCNQACESDKFCAGELKCINVSGNFVCRNEANPSDSLCGGGQPTPTNTPIATVTNTVAPTATNTLAPTVTNTIASTPTNTPIVTGNATNTPTNTPGNGGATATLTSTATPTGDSCPTCADIRVKSSVSDSRPDKGETITYTTRVRNYGPSSATGVALRLYIPSGLTYIKHDLSNGTFSFGDSFDAPVLGVNSQKLAQGTYTFSSGNWIIGALAYLQEVRLDVDLRVDTEDERLITSEITGSSQTDDETLNNSDDVVINSGTTASAACNASCQYNSDCQNDDHICYTTSSGNRCRLPENASSTTCSNAVATATSTPRSSTGLPTSGLTSQGSLVMIAAVVIAVIIIGAISIVLFL